MAEPERLQKVLAARGVASRRGAEQMIADGRVCVNGVAVTTQGVKVDPDEDLIEVDGKPIAEPKRPIVIALNKPAGFVSTVSDPHADKTVMDLVKVEGRRLYPVGRLDKDTRGLLLLTDDGELANRLLHPSYEVEKVYIVKAWGELDQKSIQQLASGVRLEEGMTAPARIEDVRIEGKDVRFRIIITEGRKRQVRRMVREVGGHVNSLRRIKFAGIELGEVEEGKWRQLTRAELKELRGRLRKKPRDNQ